MKKTKCVCCKTRKQKYVSSGGIPSLYVNRKKCKECGKGLDKTGKVWYNDND